MNLMMDAAVSMLNSWEDKVVSQGGRAEIVVDEFLRNFSADVISRTSFGSSFAEGKEIFYKTRQLQKAMAKNSMLIGVPGSRYVLCIYIIIYGVITSSPEAISFTMTYYDSCGTHNKNSGYLKAPVTSKRNALPKENNLNTKMSLCGYIIVDFLSSEL